MTNMPIGVDIAKNVFQLHWVNGNTGEIFSKQLKRSVFLEFFANRAPCLVGMEACGGAQHWARRLTELGHQVKLMPGKFVKAFVAGNKNDSMDARAIWMAVQMPGKAVAVKTEAQQAVLALHRMREQTVKMRTMQVNNLRGLLAEYGEVMPKSRTGLEDGLPDVLERLSERLPAALIDSFQEQKTDLKALDDKIGRLEGRLRKWLNEDRSSKAIAEIPGVGLLTATAAVATWATPRRSSQAGSLRPSLGSCRARRDRWSRSAMGYQQTRRYLLENTTHPWCAQRALSRKVAKPMDQRAQNTTPAQRRCSCAGQQNGPFDLGCACT